MEIFDVDISFGWLFFFGFIGIVLGGHRLVMAFLNPIVALIVGIFDGDSGWWIVAHMVAYLIFLLGHALFLFITVGSISTLFRGRKW